MTSEEMFEQYGAAIHRVAATYTPPGATRDDLVQDIAVALIGALPRWRGDSSLLTYIYRIAHHCGMRTLDASREDPDDEIIARQPSTRSGPEQSLAARQKHERLARSIRQLPLGLRLPLALRLEGLSYEDIGEVLGLNANTVGVRLHRATAALKQMMEAKP